VLTADLPAAAQGRPGTGPTTQATVAKPGVRWVTTVAAAGRLAGILSAVLQQPTFTSSALLLTPSRYSPVTQVAMAHTPRNGGGGAVP
jgi:hypothetical protein